jgi:hypothetical protein
MVRLADQLRQDLDGLECPAPPDRRGMTAWATPELLPHIPAVLIPRRLRREDDEPLVALRAERRSLLLGAGERCCGLHGHTWLFY